MTIRLPPDPSRSDDLVAPSLQLIADSVATISGFGVAVIREARADGRLHVLALGGSHAPLLEEALAEGTLTADVVKILEHSDGSDGFCFMPEEEVTAFADPRPSPAIEAVAAPPHDDPQAWRPRDVLFAPFRAEDGRLLATLDLDAPLDGKRPSAEKREALNRYAVQAGRAVATHLDRARLAREVEQADAARRIIRDTSFAVTEEAALRSCAPAVMECFGAMLVVFWLAATPETDLALRPDGTEQIGYLRYPPTFLETLQTFAEHRDVGIIGRDQMRNSEDDPHLDLVLRLLAHENASSALLAPIGVPGTVFGSMVIMRPSGAPAWTESEIDTIVTICGDLGRALQNARDYQYEHMVVRDLRRLDRFRSDLLRTVSHELKSPLTAILGNAELLQDEHDPATVARVVGTIERAAQRLDRTIADLTAHSSIGASLDTVPVDLGPIVREACALFNHTAVRHTLTLVLPEEPVMAQGHPELLDRVVVNLVSNAVKYTPDGGRVTVTLRRVEGVAPMVELVVSDTGIGISPEDQARMFSSFFRSSDPRAASQPGTGLGLAITQRIVTSLGGTIRVESRLGEGSTFVVLLREATS